jgi:F0F1-type ATP synthase epsilon subunit
MMPFHFRLLSLESTLFDDDITYVTLPGIKGQFTLYANHMPFITAITSGLISLSVHKDNIPKAFPIVGGFVDMTGDTCTVFTDDHQNVNGKPTS